ncbi:hypothetical protein V5T82_07250 [Magnetovibrio sp. PR-2]|uniref:Bbp19 family protein n=1 Tax=Magnetovibrio sp. PR-2 TaxID=3120356 RepID=UPI002FCE5E14
MSDTYSKRLTRKAVTTSQSSNDLVRAYASVFDTPAGEQVMLDLLTQLNHPKIDNTAPDPTAIAIRHGRREIVEYILKKVDKSEEL